MPSSSGHSETKDREPADETTAEAKNTNADQTSEIERDHPSCNQVASSRRLRDRVRIVTLEAEVALHERERASLNKRITRLESDVETLEEEIATLEDTVACKERRHQQVVDQYERIITNKDRQYQAHVEGFKFTPPASDRSTIATIRQFVNALTSWLKRARIRQD